ncbi:hypothetical protein BDR05DRAFT_886616 [Suillus weaverae]|nr:hypothetical protein BDR05DRAFT_886616 [Suillus weaverae]
MSFIFSEDNFNTTGNFKYHTTRKVQLTNTLIHAKAKEMNANQPVGSHYTLVELREMVTNDPQMKRLTEDEKVAYIAALTEHCDQKVTSVGGNKLAAARDVLLTAERVIKELNDLHVCTGTYATLFIVCGHVNDTIQSTMHGTDNSEDFWEDYVVHQSEHKFVANVFPSCSHGEKDIAMNYINYESAIVEAYAVWLTGWPQSISFISPSNIGTVTKIWKLCDALKAQTCYWAVLTPAEVKAHTAELDAHHSAGEVVCRPHKKCSDTGVSCKRKAVGCRG